MQYVGCVLGCEHKNEHTHFQLFIILAIFFFAAYLGIVCPDILPNHVLQLLHANIPGQMAHWLFCLIMVIISICPCCKSIFPLYRSQLVPPSGSGSDSSSSPINVLGSPKMAVIFIFQGYANPCDLENQSYLSQTDPGSRKGNALTLMLNHLAVGGLAMLMEWCCLAHF